MDIINIVLQQMDKIFKPCNTHYVEPPHPQISMFQRACYQKWYFSGFDFFRPLGLINALQVTLTLNFGGEGGVLEPIWFDLIPWKTGWLILQIFQLNGWLVSGIPTPLKNMS